MKNLFISRHAEAVPPTPALEDLARPLTARGMRDAAQLGGYWHQQGVRFDKIMASPAVRTAKTAQIVAMHLPYSEQAVSLVETLHEAPSEAVTAMMYAWSDAWQHVLLVSHRPLIWALIIYLTGEQLQQLPPCGYTQVRLDIASWQAVAADTGKVVSIGSPRNL